MPHPLIVGDPTDLWWHYESPGTAVTCHLLRLRAIERPDELMKVWESLRTAAELVVDLERDGAPHTLRWTITAR